MNNRTLRKSIGTVGSISLLLTALAAPAHALYSRPAGSFSAGGGVTSSNSYANLGVIAQPGIVGSSVSANYSADHGLLPVLGGWKLLYPVIAATPGTLSFTIVTGSDGDQSLGISNVGGSTLSWSVTAISESRNGGWLSFSPSAGSGNASVTVTANTVGLAAGNYSDTLTISGTGISQTVQVQVTLTVTATQTYSLTVTAVSDSTGKGGGGVNSDPAGIACAGTTSRNSICAADFAAGTTVTLMQTPDSNSTWATWSYPGCGTNQNCQVVMNGAQQVTATFPYAYMAEVNSSGARYNTLTQAYAGAAASDTLLARDVTFIENFTLGSGKTIVIDGGMSTSYAPLNAWTTLQGILAIQSGSLAVDRLVIK